MKAPLSRSQVIGPAVAAVVLVLIAAGVRSGWFDAHAGTAAWVQAIGAIAIVLATGWIAGMNFAEERRRQREGERHLWKAIAAMSEECLDCLWKVMRATEVSRNRDRALLGVYQPSDLDAPMEGLAAVPLHQLGELSMVQAVVSLRRVMGRVRTELNAQYHHLTNATVSRGFDVDALRNYKTEAFNAHASIVRLAYGKDAEERLRRF